MVRLRGHHLICLHFFDGEGYDQRFRENLRTVIRAAEAGDIMICGQADDVCGECAYRKGTACAYDDGSDAAVREMDAMALSLLHEGEGAVVSWEMVAEKIPALFPQWYANQCDRCEWVRACEKNSAYMRLKG